MILSAARRSLLAAECPQVDSELLALLIEMAALETQRLGGVGNVVLVAREFRQKLLALEVLHALGERTCGLWSR